MYLFRDGIGGAHRAERAALAFGAAGGAVLAAEQHQPVAEVRGLRGVDQFAQRVFHLDRVFLVFDKASAVGQAAAVRVGHNGGLAEDVAQNQVRGLAADAGELE